MVTGTGTGATFSSDAAFDIYISGLRYAHASETLALQRMARQLERIDDYPEVEQLLRKHGRETEEQVRRIDDLLHALSEDRSILNEMATAMSGNMAAPAPAIGPDEILKNHFANHAFEAFEIASYESLVAMAEAMGHRPHAAVLRESLGEEETMAQTLREMTPKLTVKVLRLAEDGPTRWTA